MNGFLAAYLRNRGAIAGVVVLLFVAFVAATASVLFPFSPWDMRGIPFAMPGEMDFLLGSDSLGRDVAAGIAYGARVSLLIGAVSTAVAVFLGVTLGAIAGYAGGIIDDAIMRSRRYLALFSPSCWSRSFPQVWGPSSPPSPSSPGRQSPESFAPNFSR